MTESYIILEITRAFKITPALYFSSKMPGRGEQVLPDFWDGALSFHHTKDVCFVIEMHPQFAFYSLLCSNLVNVPEFPSVRLAGNQDDIPILEDPEILAPCLSPACTFQLPGIVVPCTYWLYVDT